MDPFTGPGWCKFYASGPEYYATDPELRRKSKSWRSSELGNIVMVMIRDKNLNTARIKGTGEFWQSDTQVAKFVLGKSIPGTTVSRRIMKKIEGHDKAILIRSKTRETFAEFLSSVPPPPDSSTSDILFIIDPSDHLGMWFVLETNIQTGLAEYYLSPEKI